MNDFKMTDEEMRFLSDIHASVKSENISYIIGIDRLTKKRRIFQIIEDSSVDPPAVFIGCEVLTEDSDVFNEVDFELTVEKTFQYKERKWYHRLLFWNRRS